MIVELFFFILAAFLGIFLIYILKLNLFFEEKITWGVMLGTVLLVFACFVFSYLLGFNATVILASFAVTSSIIGIYFLKDRENILKNLVADSKLFLSRIKKGELNIFLLVFLSALILFGTLWPRVLYQENQNIYTVGTSGVWGDWAAHSAYVSHFAYSDTISLEHPLYAGIKFSYTFMPDFLSAIFIKLGLDIISSMIVPGFVFSMALVILLYYFSFRLSKKESVAALTVLLFIFNGGLGFLYFFKDIANLPYAGLMDFLKNSPLEYAHLADKNIHWTALINNLVLPQRAFTMGMPLGILVLTSILIGLREVKNNKMFLYAGIIAAFLPAIHIHSLVAVSFLGFFLIILFSGKNIKLIARRFLFFFGPIIILGFWQILFLFPGNGYSYIVQLGWMAKDENWIYFWVKNLGFNFFFILPAFFAVSKRMRVFYIPFFLLFVIANIFLFQPHDYDNIKIMEYWFLPTSVILSIFLVKIWQESILSKLFVCAVLPLMILAPVLDLAHLYLRPGYLFLMKEEIKVAEIIKEKTPQNSVFLTSDKHNHLVPVLTGRQILMGYRGWLWTYGIKYQGREKDIADMYSGAANAKKLLEKYGVDYVFIGPAEKSMLNFNEQFFAQNYPLFFKKGDIKIYKVSR